MADEPTVWASPRLWAYLSSLGKTRSIAYLGAMTRKYGYVDYTRSAEVLRQGRRQLGLSQREMSEILDIEPATYAAIENARRRFPLQRLRFLPDDLARRLRDTLVAEFEADLDQRIAGTRTLLSPKQLAARKALVAAQPAELS